jgi:hypothetical protein
MKCASPVLSIFRGAMGCVFEAMIHSEPEVLAGKRVAYTLQRSRAKRVRQDLIDSKLGNIPLGKCCVERGSVVRCVPTDPRACEFCWGCYEHG